MPTPDPVDGHAREERIRRCGQPVHEAFAPSITKIHICRLERESRLYGFVLLRTLRISGRQYVTRLAQQSFVFLHRPVRGHGWNTTELPLFSQQRVVFRDLLLWHDLLDL